MVKESQKSIRRSKGILEKKSRPKGYKKEKVLWNQQRKILWKIKRVLGKAGKGIAIEIDLGGH